MTFLKNFIFNTRHIVLYGLILALLVFLLKWFQWKFLIVDNSWDLYVGLIAIFFTVLGVWVATQLAKPKTQTVIVEKKIYMPLSDDSQINEAELKQLSLSNREHEVLQLLAKGYSNAEIARSLYLSLSTVKTHVSNIFVKMEVKSRAQAIERCKRLRLTP